MINIKHFYILTSDYYQTLLYPHQWLLSNTFISSPVITIKHSYILTSDYYQTLFYPHEWLLSNTLISSPVITISGFGYADDLKLLTPSVHALRILANICEKYAAKYDITFNGKKSQLIIYKCKRARPPDPGIFYQ